MYKNSIIYWSIILPLFHFLSIDLVAQVTVSNDTTYCGDSVTLVASSTTYSRSNYDVSQIAYSPDTITGGFINFTANPVAGPLPIGFSFCYFDSTYTDCYITSSGFISFVNPTATAYSAIPLPFAAAAVPNNSIFPAWQDWNAGLCGIPPCVQFFTTGTAPNRRYIVTWNDILMSNGTCPGMTGTFQLVLYEGSDIIQMHIIDKPTCPAFPGSTQGLHNQDGTVGITPPGRNAQTWTASNESWQFTPSGIDWFVVGGGQIGSGDSINVAPTAPTSYYALVRDCNGNTMSDTVTVDFQLPAALIHAGPDQLVCADSTVMGALDPNPRSGLWSLIGGSAMIENDTLPGTAIMGMPDGIHVFEWAVFDGCDTIRDTVLITRASSNLTISGMPDSSLCNGDSSGSIDVSATGTHLPLSFSWSTGDTTEDLANIPAGIYTVTVSDTLGCFIDTNIAVAEPSPVNLISFAFDAGCFGDSTGFIVVNASGGTPPYLYSIDSMNFQTSDTLAGLMGGTYYIVVVDANGCVERDTSVLIQWPAIIVGVDSQVNPACPLDTTGSITFNAMGGNPPYQYSIDDVNFQSNPTFVNLPAGPDTVVVVDGIGCFAELPFNLVAPNAVQLMLDSLVNITCFGFNDGSIAISASGGTPPYSYSIDGINFFASNTFNNLIPGSYVATVQDSLGCSDTIQVNIQEPALLSASTIAIPVSCVGSTDGFIIVTAAGGTPPYLYINGADTSNIPVFDSLAAGIYDSISVIDSNGCTFTLTDSILSPPVVVIDSLVITEPSCYGSSDGVVTTYVTGSNTPYEFSIDAVNYYFNNACPIPNPGPVTIYIRDSAGCVVSVDTFVSQPDSFSTSILSQINPTCPSDSNGSVQVSVSGGTPPYQFSSDGINFQSDSLLTMLPAGPGIITVIDANACSDSIPFTLSAPDAIAPLISAQSDVSCFGFADGIIMVNTVGGSAPYLFSIDGTNFQQDSTFNNLDTGTYVITVEDALNCRDTVTVTISEPSALTISSASTDVSCNGDTDGTITVTAAGGVPPYLYVIGTDTQTNNTFSMLTAGIYDPITVIDSNGCVATTMDTINEPPALVIDSLVTADASCNGNADGTVLVFASGGTLPYLYSSDGVFYFTVPQLTGLSAGTFLIEVFDFNQCVDTASIVISEPSAIGISVPDSLVADVSCNGQSDGSAVILIDSGGIPPFMYSIDGVNFQPGNTFTNLAAGTYNNVQVMDSSGCIGTTSFVITEPPPIVIAAQVQDITCFGDDDGQVTITGSGGTIPYLFSIDGGTTYSGTNTFINLPPGIYDVAIQDDSGCVSQSSVTVLEPDVFAITAVTVDVSCFSYTDGSVTIQTSGGVPPYDAFAISDDGINFISGTSNAFNNLPAGNYTVVADDGNNCPASVDFVINEPALDTFTLQIDSTSCFGSSFSNGSISIFNASVHAPYSFSIDNEAFSSDSIFGGLTAGLHTLTWLNANGCMDTIEFWVPEPDPIIVFVTPDTLTIDLATSGQVFTTFSGADSISYNWVPSTGLSCADCPNPIVQAFGPSPVEYQVFVEDLGNPNEEPPCFGTGSFILIVSSEQRYFMPNAFTPNNDGENDILYVYGENVQYINLEIFDRWGNKLFASERLQDGWDGRYQGDMMQNGVYTYSLKVVFLNNEEAYEQGSVTLIR